MDLSVIGNINFCLDDPKPDILTYKISGTWVSDYNSSQLIISKGASNHYNISGYQIMRLISEIKGCEYNNVDGILKKYGIDFNLSENTAIQEFDIIKSLFNLFYWFDFQLQENPFDIIADPIFEDPTGLPTFFDEFIIDMPEKTKEGNVKDIYLIKEEYNNPIYRKEIETLVKINLLSEFKISAKNKVVQNYFIPFTKPAYRIEIYEGENVLEFYKKLINDRHTRINKHFNR